MVCRNLHESLVVFVNFEDVQIIFGIDELLNSAVVGRDCNYAGQVLEARLAVHPHLLFSENKYQIWKPCLSHLDLSSNVTTSLDQNCISLAHHFHILAKIPFSHLSQTAVSVTNLEDAGKLVLSADLQFHSFWYLKPK